MPATLVRFDLSLCSALAMGFVLAGSVAAQDEFRVDTEVFIGGQKQPSYETLTVFTRDLAYDFQITEPKQTTIFDDRRGKVTILDPVRGLKCIVTTDEMVQFAAKLRTGGKPKSKLFAFAVAPAFEENFVDTVGELRLTSDVLSYSATGVKPKTEGLERIYRGFADTSARLNAMQKGNLPPFPRLELNRTLSAKGLVPSRIELQVKEATGPFGRSRTETFRTEHHFNWSISQEDRKRIAEADGQLVNYKACEFAEFYPDPPEVAENPKTATKTR